jgi:signal transduction histidine kinase
MSKSVESVLKYKYYTIISILFFSFSVLLILSYRYSYYSALEKTLENMAEGVKKEIELSYYDIKKSLKLHIPVKPFSMQVYRYEDNGYYSVLATSKRVKKVYEDGFHIEKKDGEEIFGKVAHYGKFFDIYQHYYYVHVSIDIDEFIWKNTFLLSILVFLLILYLSLLYFGSMIIHKTLKPLQAIIDEISKIEDSSSNMQLYEKYNTTEYSVLAHAINTILKKLNTSLIRTKHFNAKVSHELRTPLTIIRGEIEVALLKERMPDDYKAILKSTLEEVDTLQSITDNMLLLTKLDFQAMHIKKLQIRVDKMIQEVISSSLIQAESKSIRIIPQLESITFPMEEILIKQSIKNLINNAIKYSPRNTTININLYRESEHMIIEVYDEGYGIPKEDIENLFKPYFRSSISELEEISGEGLGLAIVYNTLQLHHAEVTVKSEINRGTQFKLLFKYEK